MDDPVDPVATGDASLGRKAQLVLASQAFGAVLGYLALLAIGRYFAPAAYGSYVFATSALGAVAILSGLGFGDAHVHFVARGVPADKALGVYARIRGGLVLGLSALVLVLGLVLRPWLEDRLVDASSLPVLAAALGIQALSSLRFIGFDSWLGREQVNRAELVKTVDSLLALLGLAVIGLASAGASGRWTPIGPLAPRLADLLGLAGPLTVGQAALAIVLVYLGAKLLSSLPVVAWLVRDRVAIGPWDRDLARQYTRYALPVAAAAAATLVIAYTDVVLIGYFLDAEAVGAYGAALRLANLALLAAVAAATPLLPRFSALLEQGRTAEAVATLKQAERGLLLLAVPVGVALVALPGPILHVAVGDAYLAGAASLRWLGLWAIAASLLILGRTKVLGTGKARVAMVAGFLAAGLNLALNLLLVPDAGLGLGAPGAALGSLAATVVAVLYLRLRLRREHGVPMADARLMRIAVAGLALAAGWWFALDRLGAAAFDRLWELAGWGVGGLLVFWGLCWALGVIDRPMLAATRRMLDPRHLLAELRGR